MFSIIIVDYKSIKKTLEYINHIIKFSENTTLLSFVIVDNSNEKNAADFIKKNFSVSYSGISVKWHNVPMPYYKFEIKKCEILLIVSGSNLGYAKGNNVGALFAEGFFHSNYFVFSNNDLRLKTLLDWMCFDHLFKKYPSCAIIGPQIVDLNGNRQSPGKFVSVWIQLFLYYYNVLFFNLLGRRLNIVNYEHKSKFVDWLMGCFVIIDSKKFFIANMYDENTFLYYEELILSNRLTKKGYTNFFFNDVIIYHEHGGTSKKRLSFLRNEIVAFKSGNYYFENYKKISWYTMYLIKVNFYFIYLPMLTVKMIIRNFILMLRTKNKNEN